MKREVLCAAVALLTSHAALALINGQVAAPGEFDAVMLLASDRPSKCTAVLVGPRVLLTSAACVRTGGSGEITLGGRSYHATFTLHPQWPAQEADVALGVLDRKVERAEPEWVSGEVHVGDKLTLAGTGYWDADAQNYDGVLRIGATTVTDFHGHYVLSGGLGSAFVSYADNGGPAFAGEGDERTVVGLISFGDRRSKNYLMNLAEPLLRGFLEKFAAANDVVICGVTDGCGERHHAGKP